MIQVSNTIVYKAEDGSMKFYWLCLVEGDEYVFFDWYANPRKATYADYWRMGKDWFDTQVKEGKIEVYEYLPMDKYGDVFERQAIERNRAK